MRCRIKLSSTRSSGFKGSAVRSLIVPPRCDKGAGQNANQRHRREALTAESFAAGFRAKTAFGHTCVEIEKSPSF